MKVVACQLLTPLPLLLAALVSPSSQDRAPKKARLADAIEQANGDGEEPRHCLQPPNSPTNSGVSSSGLRKNLDGPKIGTSLNVRVVSPKAVAGLRFPDSGFCRRIPGVPGAAVPDSPKICTEPKSVPWSAPGGDPQKPKLEPNVHFGAKTRARRSFLAQNSSQALTPRKTIETFDTP